MANPFKNNNTPLIIIKKLYFSKSAAHAFKQTLEKSVEVNSKMHIKMKHSDAPQKIQQTKW